MKLLWKICEINITDFSFNKRDLNLTLTNRGVHQMQIKTYSSETKILQ